MPDGNQHTDSRRLALLARAERDTVLDQRGEVGWSKSDARGGLAIVLDIGWRVQMMGKLGHQATSRTGSCGSNSIVSPVASLRNCSSRR